MVLLGPGIVALPAAARADGAFPAAQSVMLPRDRPSEMVLATTFGLLSTEDDGATWQYSCETNLTLNGRLYIMGPAPDDRIYGVSDPGAPVTADGACTWTLGGGALGDVQSVGDVFPDPSDPSRVFALARPASEVSPESTDRLVATSVYRSTNGGLNYVGPLFSAPMGSHLTGIEVAASLSTTVYMTYFEVTTDVTSDPPKLVYHPRLAQSDDGGDNWTTIDLEPSLGPVEPRLAAVDPTDPARVYLLLISAPTDPSPFQELAITTDAGGTWSVPLLLNGAGAALAGFVRLPNATLNAVGLLAGPTSSTPIPTVFRSVDAGKTFTSETVSFHPVGLAQRNGTLFASTNNIVDGYALASSKDGGHSWSPRLRFRDVAGIKSCVFHPACQMACDFLAGETLWPPETCNRPPDPAAAARGCGCGWGGMQPAHSWGGVAIAVFVMACMAVHRRRRGSSNAHRKTQQFQNDEELNWPG